MICLEIPSVERLEKPPSFCTIKRLVLTVFEDGSNAIITFFGHCFVRFDGQGCTAG